MSRILLLALALPLVALAGETVEVKTPVKDAVQADKVTDPEPGTPEHAIVKSIEMLTAGKFDKWMDEWCHPTRCPADPASREELARLNLAAARNTAGKCVHDDGHTLLVTRRDQPSDGEVTVWVWCEPTRMPAPSTLVKVGDRWQVSSFSW